LEPQILIERFAAIDRKRVDSGPDPVWRVAEMLRRQMRGSANALDHPNYKNSKAATRRQQGEGCGDGRFADTTLPGHEGQFAVEHRIRGYQRARQLLFRV
jgi:hypothetical protein